MLVLALDTTTDKESVAVVEGGCLRGEVRLRAPDAHSRHVLPAAAFLLERLSLRPLDLGGIAVTLGPGSFTGIRVGLGTAQGVALASGRPCLGICTLDVLAARVAGAAERLVAVMDAYRGEVFAAVYDRQARRLGEPARLAPAALVHELPEEVALVGEGAERHREAILTARPRAVFPPASTFLAATLGRLAERRLEEGEGVAPAALRPIYLREAEIRPPRS